MISLIAAMDRNRTIGKDNRMPWRLPADMAYFKKLTTGHSVIMGRKTFESIGKPLPGRRNIIITRDREFAVEGCIVCHSVEEALKFDDGEEVFIIGGAEVYAEFMPHAGRLYITLLEEDFAGDAFFPEINTAVWKLVSKTPGEKNEKNPYTYAFVVFDRA